VNDSLETSLNGLLEMIVQESGTGLARVFSMKREFPDALHQLLSQGSTTLKILPEHFPFLLRDKGYALTHLHEPPANPGLVTTHIVTKRTPENDPVLKLELVDGTPNSGVIFSGESAPNVRTESLTRDANNLDLLFEWKSEEWTLTQSAEDVGPEDIDDIIFELKYTVPTP
jgi:hypothetical protein